MKKAIYVFTFVTICLWLTCPFNSVWAQTGFYFGGWGGYTISPGTDDDDWDGHDHYLDIDETSAWGIKVGYANPFLKYLSFEAEYSYLNPDFQDEFALDGHVRISNLMFNVLWKQNFGMIQPYVGVGGGFSYSDMHLEDIRGIDDGDYTSYAWQFLIGAELFLTPQMAVDVGYRYYVTEMEFDHHDSDKLTLYSGMVTLGLKLFF